ncbi:MAG TPA: hypothetical protein VFS90_09775, partial [Pyrinomonadaceae bacterium]|nr:hypothetical protein [Pyrinomonadaceae bacterium]
MHIISFATQETEWSVPRPGMILEVGGHDSGYRLDCEKLFPETEHPSNPLAWFDLDGPWFQTARATHDILIKDKAAFAEARDKGWLVPSSDAYWF